MKNILILIFALCSGIIYAQQDQVEPTYELNGDLVAVTTYYEDGAVKEEGFYKDKPLSKSYSRSSVSSDPTCNTINESRMPDLLLTKAGM